MAEFEYDESGRTTYFFLVSFLALYLLPATYYRLFGSSASAACSAGEEDKPRECQCAACVAKRAKAERRKKKEKGTWRSRISFWDVLYVVALLVFLWGCYKVTTFETEALWDPYEVLDLPTSATTAEIKKRFRELSRTMHPDKSNEPDAEDKFIRISKAHQALTDDATRENWQMYGNPDGRQAATFGIALPSWMVDKDNATLVLFAYFAVFIIGLPIAVKLWWDNSIKFTREGIMMQSLRLYAFKMATNLREHDLIMRFCLAEEFEKIPVHGSDKTDLPALLKKVDQLPSAPEKFKRDFQRLGTLKASILLYLHLNRFPPKTIPKVLRPDLEYILKKTPTLINGMLDMSYGPMAGQPLGCFGMKTPHRIMRLSQMIVQGSSEHREFHDIPHITDREIKFFTKKKRHIRTIREFYRLSRAEIEEMLGSLSEQQIDDIMLFGENFPFVSPSVEFKVPSVTVAGDANVITEGAIVSAEVTLERMGLEAMRSSKDDPNLRRNLKDLLHKPAVRTKKVVRGKGWRRKVFHVPVGPDGKPLEPTKPAEGEENGTSANDADPGEAADDEDADGDAKTGTGDEADGDGDEEGDGDGFSDSDEEAESEAESDIDDETMKRHQNMMRRRKEKMLQQAQAPPVHCPLYPGDKQEQWWVFFANEKENMLLTMPQRVIALEDSETVEIVFRAPRQGTHVFQLNVVSDSYLSADVQQDFELEVGASAEAEEISDIEEESDDQEYSDVSSDEDEDF